MLCLGCDIAVACSVIADQLLPQLMDIVRNLPFNDRLSDLITVNTYHRC